MSTRDPGTSVTHDSIDPAVLDRVVQVFARARSALFITGAGISADSGLPTYRGIGGLYEDTSTDEGLPIEVALSGEMMSERPEVCWKYIHQIERACRGATWNRGHEVLARLEERYERTWVLTQNVDGFHRRAGSNNVIEIHGDVHKLACTRCSFRATVEDYAALAIPPRCARCEGIVRPEVVLFGEMLPMSAVAALERELKHGFDLVVSIGTTSVFPYIAAPVVLARRAGRDTVEINPGETGVSHVVAHRLQSRAAVALDAIWRRL
ncbi:MAG TPA: NAD-dependent protein deacylase [Kofleriaceae bacterium]|nr:NAD-dependent protein deacylase [Kofleriaceae bacterium]